MAPSQKRVLSGIRPQTRMWWSEMLNRGIATCMAGRVLKREKEQIRKVHFRVSEVDLGVSLIHDTDLHIQRLNNVQQPRAVVTRPFSLRRSLLDSIMRSRKKVGSGGGIIDADLNIDRESFRRDHNPCRLLRAFDQVESSDLNLKWCDLYLFSRYHVKNKLVELDLLTIACRVIRPDALPCPPLPCPCSANIRSRLSEIPRRRSAFRIPIVTDLN
ncbi:hypothetical protein GGR57DRAFT_19168 [Xylariaceae sp. FL1272]|nr:hypothetical protein GGR57DRAFT_19168 [Xylariaceae sp. FL1272]